MGLKTANTKELKFYQEGVIILVKTLNIYIDLVVFKQKYTIEILKLSKKSKIALALSIYSSNLHRKY
jgi:hypothetical protein